MKFYPSPFSWHPCEDLSSFLTVKAFEAGNFCPIVDIICIASLLSLNTRVFKAHFSQDLCSLGSSSHSPFILHLFPLTIHFVCRIYSAIASALFSTFYSDCSLSDLRYSFASLYTRIIKSIFFVTEISLNKKYLFISLTIKSVIIDGSLLYIFNKSLFILMFETTLESDLPFYPDFLR